MTDLSYFSLEALSSATDPRHLARWFIIQSIIGRNKVGTLEPMTIVNPTYLGAGCLEYDFPNPGKVPNVNAAGRLSSQYKGKNSWRFFTEPMRDLHDLGQQGRGAVHLLCARFVADGDRVKNLFPLVCVSAVSTGGARAFSAQNARPRTNQEYLEYCANQSKEWLS